jgi:nucleoside recognition membrane protein YjiH
MIRTAKILIALCLMIIGCTLTIIAPTMLSSDMEWLTPVFSVTGFVTMMVAGLYCFLKVAKPLIYGKNTHQLS